MTEGLRLITGNQDPMLIAPNPGGAELRTKVEATIGFFGQQFGLDIDSAGVLHTEPSADQLLALYKWHKDTKSLRGEDMPDFDTFVAKAVLARALMPQVDDRRRVRYLFGKGAGAELSLQGQVVGRPKKKTAVKYRSHDDFEIYAAPTTDYDALPNGPRFRAVFGPQEIYPHTYTKALREMPADLLVKTTERVDFGGLEFLVPLLEAQFVEKMIKGNDKQERKLRGQTDAELLAQTYELNPSVVHNLIAQFVVAPALRNFDAEGALRRIRKNRLMGGVECLDLIGIGGDSFRLRDADINVNQLLVQPDADATKIINTTAAAYIGRHHEKADAILQKNS